MPPRPPLLGLLAATALTPFTAAASGTYPPAPPRLGAEVIRSIDADRYNLGKALFTGRAAGTASAPPATAASDSTLPARQARLADVQAKLPARVRTQTDLPALAPGLTDAEADALLYYLGLRFRLETAS